MKISFPHLGNYHIPIEMLLRFLFPGAEILPPAPITNKTLDLGTKHSPEFVCVPFKYNLGNFIEALQNGADTIMQGGGGCRFGYYGELQEQILNDLGFKYKFVNLLDNEMTIRGIYKNCKALGSPRSLVEFCYYMLLILKIIKVMDKLDFYIRENIGFETSENSFLNLQKEFFKELKEVKNFRQIFKLNRKYTLLFKQIPTDESGVILKVGIVGELYTVMEPFANYFLEKELAKYKISVSRFVNASYLLFQKPKVKKTKLKESGSYLKYELGADGTHSVARSKSLAERGYDGIIHLKPFGCMPEVNAIPVLQNIGKDYEIPILYFSFDSQTCETGVKTRLEAFYDMLIMRKQKENEKGQAANIAQKKTT